MEVLKQQGERRTASGMRAGAVLVLAAMLFLAMLSCATLPEEEGYYVIREDLDGNLLPYRFEQTKMDSHPAYPIDLDGSGRRSIYWMVKWPVHFAFLFIQFTEVQRTMVSQHNVYTQDPIGHMAFDCDNDLTEEVLFTYATGDSVWLEIANAERDAIYRRLLEVGRDNNRDGMAEISGRIFAHTDVNGDSYDELLVQLESGYDRWPRRLVLLDWRRDSVLWDFELPSGAYESYGMIVQGESPDSVFYLASTSVCNGREVAPWDDCHSYLFCIGMDGALRWYETVGEQHQNGYAVGTCDPATGAAWLVAGRAARLDRPEEGDRLLAFDLGGRVVDSLVLPGTLLDLVPLDREGGGSGYAAVMQDNRVWLFDEGLAVRAKIRAEKRLLFRGWGDLVGDERKEYLFALGDESLVALDEGMRPVGRIEGSGETEILDREIYDGRLVVRRGQLTTFYAARVNSPLMVILQRFRMELLMLAGILGSGLLVALYFQRRTRGNLVQIERQKAALEEAHAELHETHRALQDAQEQLIVTAKYRQAQEIAGAFAHEIRNALFPARFALNRLLQSDVEVGSGDKGIQKKLGGIDRSVVRAIELTSMISQYTKLDTDFCPEGVDLGGVVEGVRRDYEGVLSSRGIRCEVTGEAGTMVVFGRIHLQVVVSNLMRNSIDALDGGSAPRLEVHWERAGEEIRLTVRDNGEGVSEEARARLFDAFFTTRPSSGTGLGLATVRRLVDMYSGRVYFDATVESGACFVVELQGWKPGMQEGKVT